MADKPEANTEQTRPPFPFWLRELVHFGSLIVVLTVFILTLKSDQRSTREELARLAGDVGAIRASLPNKDVLDLRLDGIDKTVAALRSDLDFEKAKAQKFKEDLLSKGVLK